MNPTTVLSSQPLDHVPLPRPLQIKRYRVMQHLPAEESLPGLCGARWLRLAGEELQTHAAAIPPPGVLSWVKDLSESTSAEQKLSGGKLSAVKIYRTTRWIDRQLNPQTAAKEVGCWMTAYYAEPNPPIIILCATCLPLIYSSVVSPRSTELRGISYHLRVWFLNYICSNTNHLFADGIISCISVYST